MKIRIPYHLFAYSIVVAIVFGVFSFGGVLGYTAGARDCAALESVQSGGGPAFVPVLASYDPSMGMEVTLAQDATPTATPVPPPADTSGAIALLAEGIRLIREGGPLQGVGVGLLLMALVFFARTFLPTLVPKDYLATATLGLTALAGFASALAAGAPPVDAALTFLLIGAAAVGFWEAIAKHLYKRWKGEPEDPRPVIRGGGA